MEQRASRVEPKAPERSCSVGKTRNRKKSQPNSNVQQQASHGKMACEGGFLACSNKGGPPMDLDFEPRRTGTLGGDALSGRCSNLYRALCPRTK